jgi:hypothetical protein
VFILLCGLLLIRRPVPLCRLLQKGSDGWKKVSATLDPEKMGELLK